ncbi:hypothetical protein L484_000994 [Morus notabilis]|uniref:Uncharacterized protein n=1 Tax=Morus notabilis TaxID=981085 RepID=W9SP81_9ROSA|nr:hypothetical protein L484_000994 [Morus notabilis]
MSSNHLKEEQTKITRETRGANMWCFTKVAFSFIFVFLNFIALSSLFLFISAAHCGQNFERSAGGDVFQRPTTNIWNHVSLYFNGKNAAIGSDALSKINGCFDCDPLLFKHTVKLLPVRIVIGREGERHQTPEAKTMSFGFWPKEFMRL